MKNIQSIKIGSRASPLALVQTREVLKALHLIEPSISFELVPITTKGDREQGKSLSEIGRGAFVSDIELSIQSGEIDAAVHSAKDLPSVLPEGLEIAAYAARIDSRDVIVNQWDLELAKLPKGAKIGSGSPRRIAQIRAIRPDIQFVPIRGNIGTRLNMVDGRNYDGVLLAAAGLIRLGSKDLITEYLMPSVCTSDPGQGALAVQVRTDSHQLIKLLKKINHNRTYQAVSIERAVVRLLGGDCNSPIGINSEVSNGKSIVTAMVSEIDGSEIIRIQESYPSTDPEIVASSVKESLEIAGAAKLSTWSGEK
ncbi:MAG: hydroxymethylbilane synthase [Chloroflexota bacterium]|nr:hydroxymethylbilane synthase [Chloroflexota bacterium]